MVDPESGIRSYAISVGMAPNDQSVLSRTPIDDVIPNTFASSLLASLDPSITYHVTLFATNGAGLESITTASVYFDISSPIISGGVTVSPNFKVASYVMGLLSNVTKGAESATCLLDTDVVSILFNAPQDEESGDSFEYELGIGFSPGNDDVMAFEGFPPLPLPNMGTTEGSGTSLYHRLLTRLNFASVGRRGVYFSIRARNRAGHFSMLSSNAVFIKSNLTLERNWIRDGVTDTGSDIEYQTSTHEIGASFRFGVNCLIAQGRWAVQGVDGNLTQPYQDLEVPFRFQNLITNQFHVSSDQVQLFSNETYRILVQVTDLSGEVHILRSDGVTVATKGLVPGIVRDGPIPEQDLNYQESTTSLTACWTAFGNGSPSQEIAYYEVAAGSDREFAITRSNIAPFTNVGLNTTHTFTSLSLSPQDVRYFVTVRAFSVSGAYAESLSNGIFVGLGHSIVPGTIFLPRYQSNVNSLSAYWPDFESSLPIRQYEWALGTELFSDDSLEEFCSDTDSDFADRFDMSGFVNVNLDTYINLQGLNLQDNMTYYLTLRVLDQAKKCIAVVSPEGVVIDQTPPTTTTTSLVGLSGEEAVILGPIQSRILESDFIIYTQPGTELDISWQPFMDPESGIDFYEVGIFEQLACGNASGGLGPPLVDFVEVGEALQTQFSPPEFESGVAYVCVVQATNRAGVTGSAYSQPILLDDLAPFGGDVKDGEAWEGDRTYQSDLSMLSAVFAHARLPPNPTVGVAPNAPCPRNRFYELSSLDSDWTPLSSATRLVGFESSSIVYSGSQVGVADTPPGVSITMTRDPNSAEEEVFSGGYLTPTDLSRGGTFQADILAADGGSESFESNSVTSVLFIDTGGVAAMSDLLAKFEPDAADFDLTSNSPTAFSAFGLQIYRAFSNATTSLPPRVVLWASDGTTGSLNHPIFVRGDIPGVDLDVPNTYRLEFEVEQQDTYIFRTAHLFVNGILMASLQGLPLLSNNTQVVLHAFNRGGFLPDLTTSDLSVRAVFANVTVPSVVESLCEFGSPFHSRRSPVVQFRAWAGTEPGLDDVVPAQVRISTMDSL